MTQINDYVSVVYSESVRPRTGYPLQLAEHLRSRFGIRPGARLLDVGCGRGEFLESFASLGLDATGVDTSDFAVTSLARYGVRKCDVSRDPLPFPDASLDVIFHKSLIEHLNDPENLMRESLRVLKPGGQVIIMVPDWVTQMPIYFDDHTHRTPYTVTSMKDMLDIFGFKETSAELFYQLPVLWKYPALKIVSRVLQWLVPVRTKSKWKFIRWSIELMVLWHGVKPGANKAS